MTQTQPAKENPFTRFTTTSGMFAHGMDGQGGILRSRYGRDMPVLYFLSPNSKMGAYCCLSVSSLGVHGLSGERDSSNLLTWGGSARQLLTPTTMDRPGTPRPMYSVNLPRTYMLTVASNPSFCR